MNFLVGQHHPHRLVRRITREAQELLTSALPCAGARYDWPGLLPEVVTAALERAVALAELTPTDRHRLEHLARQAARDWVPLHELEHGCQIVVSSVCRALWGSAGPTDCDAMLGLSRWVADRLPDVLDTMRAAYIEEMRRLGMRRPDDDVIIGALLEGGEGLEIARAAGRELPEPCAVVALACAGPAVRYGAFSFTVPPAPVMEVLARDPAALCAPSWDKTALVALLALPRGPVGESVRWVRQTAQRLIDACCCAYGHPFVAGLAFAGTCASASQAVREAVDIASVLAHRDPPRRVAFREDVALEMAASTDAALRQRLAARVAAVRARPDLWATLREIYRADLDRGRTARRLGIHRSTLDYRLDRIEKLTGARPTSVHGILLFAAAQAAADQPSPPPTRDRAAATAGRDAVRP